jgi:hypothetical protein
MRQRAAGGNFSSTASRARLGIDIAEAPRTGRRHVDGAGFGVATLLRGGDPRRSNKLMQSRVIMRALALMLLAMLMLLARH